MTSARSASVSASTTSCVTRMVVRSVSTVRSKRRRSEATRTSRADIGSSSSSTSGFVARARAIAMR
ncbi:hypothetical protein ALI44B_12595 [Leifsonia sp. ALI-44-B]|nr:hypothetical protein ALI44B_12595 [Leifsonia sp. ALI-44-B]